MKNHVEGCSDRALTLPATSQSTGCNMDRHRVAALSSVLGKSVTRKRFFEGLSAGGALAMAAIWGNDLSSAKPGNRKKGKRSKESKKGKRRSAAPERCPAVICADASCVGPTTYAGTCTTNADCPFSSIPGSICDTETRRCVRATCNGSCDSQEMCIARARDCVCLGLSEESPGKCGQCIQDALPANSQDECCSGDFCQFDKICGLCVLG